MKRRKKEVQKIIDEHLGLFGSPSLEEMDDSQERTLHHLQSKAAAANGPAMSEPGIHGGWRWRPLERSPLRSWRRFAMIPTGAAVILAAVLATTWRQDAFAVVEKVNGTLYRVVDGKSQPLHIGETVDIGTPVRTEERSGAVLKLADGARVEIHEKSEISLEHAQGGTHIRLNTGSVNVTPSTQPERNLYVQNKEVTVPVVAALFQAATPVAAQTPAAQQPPTTSSPNPAEARETFPRFEVVSVRPCNSNTPGGGRGGSSGPASPVRLRLECQTVFNLIHTAYRTFANGRMNASWTFPVDPPFSSGPEWAWRERFTIEATTAEPVAIPVMQGPMLQAVLEDRFKLKVRRESREVPIYELVVRKGGHKLTPFKPGTCAPWDWSTFPPAPPLDSGQRRCTAFTGRDHDNNWVETVEAQTLDAIAGSFINPDRYVVNKTGITGLFSYRLVYKGGEPGLALPYMEAIPDQLGLEFRPAKGLRDFLVIDHVERPTPN